MKLLKKDKKSKQERAVKKGFAADLGSPGSPDGLGSLSGLDAAEVETAGAAEAAAQGEAEDESENESEGEATGTEGKPSRPRRRILPNIKETIDTQVIQKFFKRQRPVIQAGEPYVICDNVVKIYKVADLEVFALQGLDLVVNRGELMAIIGASGSGKSTLLNILGGLDSPSAGKAYVAGWNLSRMSSSDRVSYKRDCVGFVWQNVGRNLVPYLTALENVQLPMILRAKLDKDWAVELLEAVGLGHRIKHRPMEMSGGEQQRVAIAVALANKPVLILADEPTGSLDTKSGQQVLQVFRDVIRRYGITVIVVTHDMSMANNVDRFVTIRDGKMSSETVRRAASELIQGANLFAEQTHDEYSVLDSAGRLQIPSNFLEVLNVQNSRVQIELVKDHLVIRAPKK